MGKIHVQHRVIVRNVSGQIVSDVGANSFNAAGPIYDRVIRGAVVGETVTLQHGARIIKSYTVPEK